jgi:hypothetical protein
MNAADGYGLRRKVVAQRGSLSHGSALPGNHQKRRAAAVGGRILTCIAANRGLRRVPEAASCILRRASTAADPRWAGGTRHRPRALIHAHPDPSSKVRAPNHIQSPRMSRDAPRSSSHAMPAAASSVALISTTCPSHRPSLVAGADWHES